MQLFNVSAIEFVFILLIAFIVLGPEKAIEAARGSARWISKITKSQFWKDLVTTSKEIQELPKRLMDEADLQKTIDELDRSLGETSRSINETELLLQQQLRKEENEISKKSQERPENRDGG